MTRSNLSRIVVGASGAVALLLLGVASPASAHVEVSPETVVPGTFTTFTLTVPNEQAEEDTLGIDVSLPNGFLLDSAASLAGWKTVVDTRPDGTAVAVHWSGGHIAPHTFADFALRGRVGEEAGATAFAVQQHYETTTEAWTGPPDSEQPAPTVTVDKSASESTSESTGESAGESAGSAGGGSGTGAGSTTTPQSAEGGAVPLAGSAGAPAQAPDALARTRADLALALAAAALIVSLALLGLQMRRRGGQDRLVDPVPDRSAPSQSAPATSPPAKSAPAKSPPSKANTQVRGRVGAGRKK